ncbi:hypothetical protein HHI_04925 [Hyphomonas hirschiana VP5]|uniref:DUF2306 domain-containing protein n=1 Tax=Hyphomonas hirschiana VP5 TaxID=1280951 RepID=A0A059FY77_9PROT|nr:MULTISPECIES: DUF2306 domain-containing protein [Hyphomonas]KCZ95471.1 hypothetical protein HHI_04925 [Hyphomonas hirschiana VP5]
MTASAAAPIVQTSTPAGRLTRLRRQHPNKIAAGIALGVYAGLSHMALANEGPVRFRVDLTPLLQSPFVLQAHVAGALLTFAIGCVLLAGVKGRAMHRTLGYVWVVSMAVTAISSFFLQSINPGSFSFIHALSAWTMIVLPMGLAAARRRKIAAHRKHMTGMFMGGILIAGLFSFLPGRLMWHLFFQV